MADKVAVLLGTVGLVTGECFILADGSDLVMGRSRSCDISLRRAAAYMKLSTEVRDADHEFNTVSRRHIRLQVHESVIRMQDLSTNGTFCNDQPIQQSKEMDLSTGDFALRLGTRECFSVTMLAKDDPRVIAAAARKDDKISEAKTPPPAH
jgi:pSer/pThr/pTyr-binding forkhead associated (FHA) protein